MKKQSVLLYAALLALCMQGTALAADSTDEVSIVVNGEKIVFGEDQPPVIENGRTLVPFRAVLEKMGAAVEWDNASQTVTCTLADKEVSLVIGSDKMASTDGEVTLDVPAKIIGSRTMVPIRAISEGLGAQVDWDNDTRTVTVSSATAERYDGYSMYTLNADITSGDKVIMPITVKYPVFDNAPAANARILDEATATAEGYKNAYKESAESFFKQIDSGSSSWYVQINYEVKYDSPEFVSMYRQDNIYTGGAHDNIAVGGLTVDRDNGTLVSAEQIVPGSYEKALDGIKTLSQSYVKTYGNEFANYNEPDENSFYYDGAIVYVIPPYELAPFSEGVIQYRVTEDDSYHSTGYSYKNIATKITSNGNTLLTITAKYPVLEGSSAAVTAINNALEQDAKARVKRCEETYGADSAEFEENIKLMLEDDIPPTGITVNVDGTFAADWGCDIEYNITNLDEAVMSAYVTELTFLGGAHPNTAAGGVTYNMQTGERMKAEDFVEDALNKGKAGIREMAAADPEAYPFYDEETFAFTDDDFYIEGAQLVFVVQQYEIAPYAAGIIEYRIDLEGI